MAKNDGVNIDVVDQGIVKLRDTGLTLIHPFCGERKRFNKQFELWQNWSETVKNHVKIVLIDDHGADPVHDWCISEKIEDLNINLAVYRITTNLYWNTAGALNLGVTVAPTEFVLFMDSDCGFSSDELEKFLNAMPDTNSYYRFPRQRIGDSNNPDELRRMKRTRFLPCSILMHKDVFWHLNGFDEDFIGERSPGYAMFDSDLIYRLNIKEHSGYVWHGVTAFEWLPSKIGLPVHEEKITSKDIKKQRQFMYKKHRGEIQQNKEILRFQWERTFYTRRKA